MTFSLPYEMGLRLRREFPNGRPVRVHGDSMEATLFDGDVVWVDVGRSPRFNDVVVVRIASGNVVGRWRGASLAKDNADFRPIRLTAAHKVAGVVVRVVERDISAKTVNFDDEAWWDAAMIWREGPKAIEMRKVRRQNRANSERLELPE